jgi:hypothetical protein
MQGIYKLLFSPILLLHLHPFEPLLYYNLLYLNLPPSYPKFHNYVL